MTREEEIIEASQLYAKHQQKPFMDGAMWADKHPRKGLVDIDKVETKLRSANSNFYRVLKDKFMTTEIVVEFAKKESFIEKACDYWTKKGWEADNMEAGNYILKNIGDFIKFMEE